MNNHYGQGRLLGIALLLALLAGCAATADSPSANDLAEGASDSGAGDDPNEMICRREQVTGSNFSRRVCMTRAQREEARRSTREFLEQTTSQGASSGSAQ